MCMCMCVCVVNVYEIQSEILGYVALYASLI